MKLREYIAIKHAQKTVTERALILADALNRVVEPAFEGITFDLWEPLRKNLFKSTLAVGVLTLHKGHIFEAVLTLQETVEQLQTVLSEWLTKHMEKPVQTSDLEAYFPKKFDVQIVREAEGVRESEGVHEAKIVPEAESVKEPAAVYKAAIVQSSSPVHGPILAEIPPGTETDHYFIKESLSKLKQTYSQKELLAIIKNLSLVTCGVQFIVSQFIWQPQLLSPIEVSSIEPISVMKVANTDQSVYKELVSGKKPAAIQAPVPVAPAVSKVIPVPAVSKVIPVPAVSKIIPVPAVSKVSASPAAKAVNHIVKPKPAAAVNASHAKPFAYKPFDESQLKRALKSRQSILAEDKYFNTIIQTAKEHSLDPRLLFAIAGQEQSLVRKTLPHATRIANNPFNIYGSWQKYNTSISDSSDIVCNTIVNRMKKWNGSGSALRWINKTYADDPQWHVGVKGYYDWLVDVSN